MSLTDALRSLSEIVPGRVICRPLGIMVMLGGDELTVLARLRSLAEWQRAPGYQLLIEGALREEIEARGWMWRTYSLPLNQGYRGEIEKEILSKVFGGHADSPAHALALALLAALKGEVA